MNVNILQLIIVSQSGGKDVVSSRFLLVQLENADEATPDDSMDSDGNIGEVQEESRRSSGKTIFYFLYSICNFV